MGGSSSFVSSWGSSDQQDCSNINLETSLFSPNPVVIKLLKINSKLNIEVDSARKLIATYNADIAGSLVTKDNVSLVDCIERNFEFVGIVKSLDGGNCTIQIRSK